MLIHCWHTVDFTAHQTTICVLKIRYPREMTWVQPSDLGYHYHIHHIPKIQDGRKWYLHFKARHLPKIEKKKYISGGTVVYLLKNSVKRRFTLRHSLQTSFLDNRTAMRSAADVLPCDYNYEQVLGCGEEKK